MRDMQFYFLVRDEEIELQSSSPGGIFLFCFLIFVGV